MSKELAELMFPDINKTPDYYEELYPKRDLPEGAVVTRFAPSPTGFIHMGSLFTANVARRIASQTNGVYFLRIEDTDGKREIDNGITTIINGLKVFDVQFDEGPTNDDGDENGIYGPYVQSKRKEIYQTFAKSLVEKGLAYPCFCTEEQLTNLRKVQESVKALPGYYGTYAHCRNISEDEAIEKIKNGEKFVVRLRSQGNPMKKVKYHDLIKGNIEFPENIQDIVIIKSDGLPTYHFAHAVDDHLMRTTHVIRGDEWVSSVPLHLQLFEMLGFEIPKYVHVAPIMKEEEGSKRKISKRKDPEASASYYKENGIPKESVIDYLMNIANSNFEDWRRANQFASVDEFKVSIEKMGVSGAIFDLVKLADVSKNVIATFTAERVYNEGLLWAEEYDKELAELMKKYKDNTIAMLDIERTGNKIRKDISKWSDLRENLEYIYDELYFAKEQEYEWQNVTDAEEIKKILTEYLTVYSEDDDKDTWFNKVKDVAEKLGYAREVKEYKKSPESFKGHVGDISTVIRVATTARRNTPDLYAILKILTKTRLEDRINKLKI